MRMKDWLAGAATACFLCLVAVPAARALSLDEFDRLVDYQQENFISTVLHFEYYRFNNDPELAHKAECMVELDRSSSDDGNAYLLTLILRDLNDARVRDSEHDTVEGVIRAVIARECDDR